MSRKNKEKLHRIVEAEYTPIEPEQSSEAPTENLLNLEDVAFMVMVGRKKDGQPFFHSVNLPDFFVADGLLDYGKKEVERVYDKFFDKQDKDNTNESV